MTQRVTAAFYDRPVLEVAPALLGTVISSRIDGLTVAVRLTEVEAYDGAADPGSHAYRGRTARNATMFGPPGLVYVYFTYGMHHCANLVCGPAGSAHAVLLRAGEVLTGLPTARVRRFGTGSVAGTTGTGTVAGTTGTGSVAGGRRSADRTADRRLASGPANLAKTLGLTRAHDGVDTTAADAPLWVELPAARKVDDLIRSGGRVGVGGPGGEADVYPWRFWLSGEPSVSTYRPGVKRVRRAGSR